MRKHLRSCLKPLTVPLMLGLTQPANAHEKDLRGRTDAAGLTEISFCARPSPNAFGFPGHAFVAFSDQGAHASPGFRAVGHTVAGGVGAPAAIVTYFGGGSVAGQQAEERYSHLKQGCLTLKVDRDTYHRAIEAARPTLSALGIPDDLAASAERYSLSGNDCMDFIIKVAQPLKSVGLSAPPRTATDTPLRYIQKMIATNP
ncbi:hypothetical protein [Xanthobacter versatilis]|uniref:hypothetical protein n=1 Tax=Xanthobacter autotrophicus (strain ATCC BAA-1158 / Py2) TaxID=78245 RepID=UPI00372691A1